MPPHADYLLNEGELIKLSDEKKPIYVYDWLRRLHRLLARTQKEDIKDIQKTLVDQLMKQMNKCNGHPTRRLIARSLSTIFTIGDTFLLFDTINKCTDTLKSKDDSSAISNAKLSSIVCIGIMFENLGRLMGRTFEETVTLLLKLLKVADSQTRYEIYSTLTMIVSGMGAAASPIHRDIFKALKHGMVDRASSVRSNAARCLGTLIEHAPFLHTTDIEQVFSLCFRSLDGSNYEVRCCVARALGLLLLMTHNSNAKLNGQWNQSSSTKVRLLPLEEVFSLLASGFLRGGIGFLKAGEMIKGSSLVNREIRIGISHAYVAFAFLIGPTWIEKNLTFFLGHLFDILTNQKATSTNLDALHSRRCVSFILRTILGKVLAEKGQYQALKEMAKVIAIYCKIGYTAQPRPANTKVLTELANEDAKQAFNLTSDVQLAQHVLIVSLLETGTLVTKLGPSCQAILNDNQVSLIETVCFSVTHPSHNVRLSAAWCLRCISSAVNGQLTPLIERSLERLETLRGNPESVNGNSYALSALLGGVRFTPLGIPQNKGKLIFNIAEDLLRTATQNSRLSMHRTQAGWQLMGSLMTLGPSVVKTLLPRLMLLWKNSFPRNTKELDSEKARGDAFTWQVTLENRAGALSAMACFLSSCPKLVTDDIHRRLCPPIESAITMLVSLNSFFKNFGVTIKASYSMVRLRLYQVLLRLPPPNYENCFANLLRLLVSDLTLSESVSNASSSLLPSLFQSNADVILGSWIQETEHRMIEDQVQSSTSVGSIEYDPTMLYRVGSELTGTEYSPPPLAVNIVNKSAMVFGLVFPYVAQKHRVQMLNHFNECLKQAKSTRQESIQINVLTALLGALKSLAENKMNLGTEEVRKLAVLLILNALSSANAVIRYAAAQSLGHCVQTVNDALFLKQITSQCFEKLKTARDAVTRTGYSLAIGFIHHFVVGLGSVQQLKSNISLLLALAEDFSSPSVQIWALHAITLIADSGGPMFRPYIEPTLAQSMKILMQLSPALIDVYQSIGKCHSAMITTIGPEFQTTSHTINEIRHLMLIACSVLQEHDDFLVKNETIGCLQQLHMFDRKHFDVKELIFFLLDAFLSTHYHLRRASILCLHQVAQKDSHALIECSSQWIEHNRNHDKVGVITNFGVRASNRFIGILTALLDYETDPVNVCNIKKIMNALIHNIDESSLSDWLTLCKQVLSASDDSRMEAETETEEGEFEESDFKASNTSHVLKITYRWQTRCSMMSFLSKIIINCSQASSDAGVVHFDLTLARERNAQSNGKQDYLVLHLSDLVRMSFISATSDCDDLRLEGLKTLELIIDKFAHVPEPEFEGHVILEQFQAQVGAALRPAFIVDTASHVTARACQVCSAWIGSGVAKDLNDLRRVHQLLVSSLDKLHKNSTSRLYNESASTQEKLAILKAWADVYVVAMAHNDREKQAEDQTENLLDLVSPELLTLSKYWIHALRDHAILTLPNEYITLIPPDGGAFFILETIETVRPMYRTSWPSILHAAALWLSRGKGFEILENDQTVNISSSHQFYLLFGICMEALSNPKSTEQSSYVSTYLASLKELITPNKVTKSILNNNEKLILELCQVLHRLLLTHEISDCQTITTEIVKSIVDIQREYLEEEQIKLRNRSDEDASSVKTIGEGGESGEIDRKNSIVYSLLEISLSILVPQLPQLCPTLASTPEFSFIRNQKSANYLLFNHENSQLIANVVSIVADLPGLCSPRGSVSILPSVLYLLTGVFHQLSLVNQTIYDEKLYRKQPIVTFLKCIEHLCTSPFLQQDDQIRLKWIALLQSTVARILDMSKTSDGDQKQDIISTLLSIGVFAVSAPPAVLSTPQLQYPIINLMTRALESDRDLVQLKCIETLKLIFSKHASHLMPFLHALAPKLIKVFHDLVSHVHSGQELSCDQTDSILTTLACLEILIERAVPDKKTNMLSIYISALVSLLNVEHQHGGMLSSSAKRKVKLHEQALKKLTDIALKHAELFKQIMSSNANFSERLKEAVQLQQRTTNPDSKSASLTKNQTIQLKVDFSNYK